MFPYFQTEPCASVLSQLYKNARHDGAKMARRLPQIALKQMQGGTFSDAFKTADFQNVYMPISPDEGKVLYQIARSCKPRLIVEFGSSFGISALFLGSALKDQRFGRLVGTEIEPTKVAAARKNIADAGLADIVEIRAGDALQTLKAIEEPVDLLFLDGWKDLYLPVTEMLLPKMEPGSVVVADNINMFAKELKTFNDFIVDPQRGAFLTTTLPIGNSLKYAVRL